LQSDGLIIPPQAGEVMALIERYLHPAPLLVIISGPSGVGKDSVVRRMRELAYPFHFVVTATDRPRRPAEVNGIDYHFLSTAEFERMIAADEFLEYARVYGQYKGVPKAQARQALASGMDVIMRLDVQGTATVRQKVPQALTIFLVPPSLEVLIHRLRQRGTESAEELQRRLEMALAELRCAGAFDYVVVNHEGALDQTAARIMAIIQAEKCRVARQAVQL
jgi:guanylate kinase